MVETKRRLPRFERPPKREKITAESLAERWASGAERRGELIERARQPRVVRSVVTGVLLLTMLGGSWSYQSGAQAYEVEHDKAASQISDLETTLRQIERSRAERPDEKAAGLAMDRAQSLGARVAVLQNALRDPSIEPGPVYTELAKTMTPKAAKAAKTWYTDGSDETDPTYSWSFAPTYFYGGDTIDVVWLAKATKDGALVAWTQGVYDVKADKFSSFTNGTTVAGTKRIRTDNYGTPQEDPQSRPVVPEGTIPNYDIDPDDVNGGSAPAPTTGGEQ